DGPPSPPPTRLTTLFGAGLAFRTAVLHEIFHGALPLFLTGHQGRKLSRGEDSELCLRAVLAGWELHREESLVLRHVILHRRLKWGYALRARRGGGRADAILLLYKELAEGRMPLDFRKRSDELRQTWQELWRVLPDIRALRRTGAWEGLRHSYLLGLTEGLLGLRARPYEKVRRQLLDLYGRP
ncbi:MAG: hypothetical protein V1750_05945, partial [Acidobacteriota bacterium]